MPVATPAVELVSVNPTTARHWLGLDEKGEPMDQEFEALQNRRVNAAHVDRLADDMRSGRWRQTGDTLKLTSDDEVMDGQHRLRAIIKSGRTIKMFVARDISEDAMDAIDTGKSRSFGDVLSIKGIANARRVAAAAKMLWHYENGSILQSGRAVSHGALQELLKNHPLLSDAVDQVNQAKSLQPAAIFAFVYCVAREKHPKKAEAWMEELIEHRYASGSDAARLLNKALARGNRAAEQVRGTTVAAMAIKSWNAFYTGEDVDSIAWRQGKANAEEAFPKIK